jgi:Outer membrane protein beta-barrel domain
MRHTPVLRWMVWCGLALCGSIALDVARAGNVARAGDPLNPLRQEPTLAARDWGEQPQPLAHSLVAAEGQVTEPPSVVPELLPAPGSAYGGDVHYPPGGGPPGGWPAGDDLQFPGLVHPWLAEPWFSHSDPNDPHRHIGLGQPLIGTSWRNRPLYVGTFVGGVFLHDLQTHHVNQNDTAFLGLRLGCDFDHYWAVEGRWAFARPELFDGTGAPLPAASRDYFADVSLLFYPLGDARWRPYVIGGLGFQQFRFNNDHAQRISEATLSVPIGFGLKYFYGPWFSLRFDFVDNICVGNERISGQHNVALMTGFELRFGGRRQSYYPWHNNTAYW